MEREAKANFEHSKNYDPKVLEQKRKTFFIQAINEFRKN